MLEIKKEIIIDKTIKRFDDKRVKRISKSNNHIRGNNK